MDKNFYKDMLSMTNKLLLKEEDVDWSTDDDSEWEEETETAYHELSADPNARDEVERKKQSGDYDGFRDFAEQELRSRGYSDQDLEDVDWDNIYHGELAESKELSEDSHEYGDETEDSFFVRIEHEGYSWGAGYYKKVPKNPFEGQGDWKPEVETPEEPHPKFTKLQFTAKMSPERVVEELRKEFDFVGEVQDSPDDMSDAQMESVDEDPFRTMMKYLDDIALSDKEQIDESIEDIQDAENDLYLYIVNDGMIYRTMTELTIQSLRKKIDKNIYDERKALKSWMAIADAGAKQYFDEFGGDEELTWYSKFPSEIRRAVARELAEYYREFLFDNLYDDDEFMESKETTHEEEKDDKTVISESNETPRELKEFVSLMEDMEDHESDGKLKRIQRLEKEIYGDVLTQHTSDLEESPCDYIAFLMDKKNEQQSAINSPPTPRIHSEGESYR